ncbi:hypothetical protein BJ322DRAFT_1019770 [Thelephora terrestris]|uniref:F-box domain-containing protein n=1 Tax=Thelephora terrestris TaxID=56493 RepID=A0A9P6HHI1_9AGAM|nr:hypothetical protein BJ322DRAFT_1019770 [Thelephora terrestris]
MDNGILQTLKGLNRDLSALSASSCLPTKDELCAIEDQLQSALLTVRSTKNVVISAINRLPQDVLLLIPTYFDPEAPKSVLNASHVCRLWRSVFLSSPALWGIMDSTEMSTSLMHLYLKRSGESPLDVTLETMTTTECIQQQLLDRSHRIRSLSFETTCSGQWNKFLQPFSVSALPALTDLWILADTSVDPTAFEPTMFSRAPNLRHFTFNILGPSIPIGPRATFPNLTTISVESRDIDFPLKLLDHLFDLLQSSLSLTDIDLKLHTPRVDPIVLHRRITLPSLQNLSLCCSPTLAIVLASITLPPAGVVSRIEIRGGAFPHDLMRSIVQTLSTFIAGSDELIFSRSRVVPLGHRPAFRNWREDRRTNDKRSVLSHDAQFKERR